MPPARSYSALQLPPLYYHDHFTEMLAFIERVCGDCLTSEAAAFIARLQALPLDARCLYIRMANRKGVIFDRRRFAYPELGDLSVACDDLIVAGFSRTLTAADAPALLALLPKEDLLNLCREAELQGVRASWPKAQLLAFATTRLDPDDLATALSLEAYIMRIESATLDYLLFLYFGRNADDLKVFALRDLGLVQANDRDSFQARFDGMAEARYCFACAQLRAQLDSGTLDAALAQLTMLGGAPTDYAATCQAKTAHKLGLAYERQNDTAQAIAVYRLARHSAECRERLIRLLYAAGTAGERDEAKALLEQSIDDPASDAEHDFASDFYQRKFKGTRTGALTALLRQGSTLLIDDIHRGAPEFGVIARYRRDGWNAYFTENHFWHQLFGLTFWNELFGADAAANNAFDQLPFSLIKGTFWSQHEARLTQKMAQIRAGRLLPLVLQTIARAYGQPNGLIAWEQLEIEAITAFLRGVGTETLEAMLTAMAKNFRAYRDGFPDLLLARDGALKFVEVKAEGDVVRRNQLTRMQQLQSAGLATEICRVQYQYDPQQTYVVVDVETTGSRVNHGRVTEIGAVKMRGNDIVGEWHSLINPQRAIPAFITQLTGITNAMVRDAPLFGEVADAFAAFLDDAIFAAHNVNFDYGFISAEFARHERQYRAPKLCTCAGMRRYFPGHNSYSLANLCAIYDIELENHHRALDDARAASRLLALITAQRQELIQDVRAAA